MDEQDTFLDAVRQIGLHLPSECGGSGTCGKCSLTLQPAPKPTATETNHLTSNEIKQSIRLACQHRVKNDTRAILFTRRGEVQILTEGIAEHAPWPLDPGFDNKYGIAIDLGTTTIVAYLLALDSGVQMSQAASLNPQVIYGEDIISRITHAVREEAGLEDLRKIVVSEIDTIVESLVEEPKITKENISRLSIVGNTAMHHLFLGADVAPLGVAPYKPTIRDAIDTLGLDVGLRSFPDIEVFLPPNIAGFVGGDTVGFILSQRLDLSDHIVIGIDVGTNGEIVLSNQGGLSCCSTAAGPAFEGATIRHGMRGQQGAIEHIVIKDPDMPPEIAVIGSTNPQGICGSAIVDAVSELRRFNILDSSGRMHENSSRVYNNGDFGLSYILVDETPKNRRISFNQKDVRQVQLAKAALSAGVKILLQEAEISVNEIDSVMLAGAFGSYIRPESALGIGLLPPVKEERIVQIGNAAGEGAKALLLSSQARNLAKDLVAQINYVELASHDDFQSIFIDSIKLP